MIDINQEKIINWEDSEETLKPFLEVVLEIYESSQGKASSDVREEEA